MSQENKGILHRWCDEGFNEGNVELADQLYDVDVRYFEPAAGEVRGLTALKQFVQSWRTAFPDARLRIEEQVAEGDRVATRWTFTGTHQGTFRGVPPTNEKITMGAMYFYRIASGKVVEIHAMVDSLGLMRQLGALPSIGQGNVKTV